MENRIARRQPMHRVVRYRVRVRVQGELPSGWSAVLAGLAVDPSPDGTTLVSGELPDQAAVHGLLGSIRDLGLSLISAETIAIPSSSQLGGS
jgi:hypothetical protein